MAVIETIMGTDGADDIELRFSDRYRYVKALGGRDYIHFYYYDYVYEDRFSDATIDAGAGNDTINGAYSGSKLSINGGDGNDSIHNCGTNSTIEGGAGNDTIYNMNYVSNVSISGGAGNDSIRNWEDSNNVTLNGGDGDDSIETSGTYSIIVIGGTGDDVITNTNDNADVLYKYSDGDGNDSIVGFNDLSTLQIGGGTGTYSSQQSGSDIIVTVGDGKITLVGAASLSTVNIDGTEADSKLIKGTSGPDSINNSLEGATIEALGGNDTIFNGYYDYDHWQSGGSQVNINAGAGNDFIYNSNGGDYSSIDGGAGNDDIHNWAYMATVSGGTGNDTIYGDFVTFYSYKAGDGNDLIRDFNANSTLSISGDSYSTTKSGNNIIVTVGDGKITLQGAASLSAINIDGTKDSSSDSKLIRGTEGADSINNTVEGATIQALGGNDYIYNSGSEVSINAGAGNDYIHSYDKYFVTVDAGAGADTIAGDYRLSSINGGAGNDTVEGYYVATTIFGGTGNDLIKVDHTYMGGSDAVPVINGGAGNDTIISNGYGIFGSVNGGDDNDFISVGKKYGDTTINGGRGNDTIYGGYYAYGSDGIVYQYVSGDGNDKIIGFTAYDTLQIGGGNGSYSSKTSGKNIIVTVGKGKISLMGAARVCW